jgi:hypothetical protein
MSRVPHDHDPLAECCHYTLKGKKNGKPLVRVIWTKFAKRMLGLVGLNFEGY